MKITLILCTALLAVLVTPAEFVPLEVENVNSTFMANDLEAENVNSSSLMTNDVPLEQLWESYKTLYEKEYPCENEDLRRKEIFQDNLKKITFHNYLADKGLKSFRMSVNKFTDMENKEFTSVMNGFRLSGNYSHLGATYLPPSVPITLPDSLDWRKRGYVTAIKDQGQCGSCWAFSSTGALEGQTKRKTGKLISLSESNLVDCSTKWGNEGCGGGWMNQAFQYIQDNLGINTESSYPYVPQDQSCKFSKKHIGATVTGYTNIPSNCETSLQEAAATIGPISVAIDASHDSFQSYSQGIYDEPDCSSTSVNHAVLVVGYGTDNGQDYWLVKNSWGKGWGERGYVKMSRNKENQCGIAGYASYPNV